MSQLVPAVLLALLLISPVYAVDPYESFCTSEQDFNSTANATFACVGSDAQACNDAGGNFNLEDGELDGKCEGLEFSPDKCGDLAGFTYVPNLTCEGLGGLLSDPGIILFICTTSNPAFTMGVSGSQSICCGGEENHKDICADLPKPHEAICTSEDDFLTDTAATYACFGTNADACTAAGGVYNYVNEKCGNIDTFTSDKCDEIAGFFYKGDETCGNMGYFLSSNTFETSLILDCSTNDFLPFISLLQSTCCGGANTENYKDICPDNPKPYETICTSEDDFLTDTAATYAWTCGQTATFLSVTPNLLDCSKTFLSPIFPFISQLQSTCCGGAENHKIFDICPDAQAPHEALCTSEQDYQTNTVGTYACQGKDANACIDAGGDYNKENGYCEDIDTLTPDKCGEIAEFTYVEDATCELIGNYFARPNKATILQECSRTWFINFWIPTVQATCCGGAKNIKDICSDAPKITSADICNQCNSNRDEAGVPTECFTTITMLTESGYGIPEVCRSAEDGSTVNVECKAAISSRFDCASPTSPPVPSPVTSPVASPVTSPVALPVTSPVALPVTSPVASPVTLQTTPTSTSPVSSPDSASVPRGSMHGIAILMCLMLIVHAH